MNHLDGLRNLTTLVPKNQAQQIAESLHARNFVSDMAKALKTWRLIQKASKADEGKELWMKALLNGCEIDVERLSAIGLNSVQIEGFIGSNPTMVVCHQNSVQFVCCLAEPPKPDAPKRKIGFIVDQKEETVQ